MNLEIGMRGTQKVIVDKEHTAAAVGSGMLEVFATPYMVALMELTALKSVEPCLEPGQGTVGTLVDVKHISATPVGMQVRCESELIEIDRRRLVFNVRAFDDCGLIGEGRHERFIIDNERFMKKTKEKLNV